MTTKTKEGKPRKPRPDGQPKVTITHSRLMWRNLLWENVKLRLQHHLQSCKLLKIHGETSRIARCIGIPPSQIHRFACPHCNHDQEPNFSIGFALMLYLEQNQHTAARTRSFPQNHPAIYYTKNKPK